MNYFVIRLPCLMEDEDRYFLVKWFQNEKEAEEWVAQQENEFFKPSDYIITERKG